MSRPEFEAWWILYRDTCRKVSTDNGHTWAIADTPKQIALQAWIEAQRQVDDIAELADDTTLDGGKFHYGTPRPMLPRNVDRHA